MRALVKSFAFVVALLSVAVPIAAADVEWCTDDPPVVLTTPHGNTFVVYETLGAPGNAYATDLAAGYANTTYTATNTIHAGTLGTTFTLSVPVANDPVLGSFAVEGFASSLPMATGTIYASYVGTSGNTSTLTFWQPIQ